MNKRFIKISLGILIFLSISFLGFTFIFGNKKTYIDGSIEVPKSSLRYSGFEEDEDKYNIKVSVKNNSKYYGLIRDIKLQFQVNSKNGSYVNPGPIFGGYDITEREYLQNYTEEEEVYYSAFFNPDETKYYMFEIPKGLSFDEKVFDTNRMMVSYNIEYFRNRIKENGVSGSINMESTAEIIDNSSYPYVIK